MGTHLYLPAAFESYQGACPVCSGIVYGPPRSQQLPMPHYHSDNAPLTTDAKLVEETKADNITS